MSEFFFEWKHRRECKFNSFNPCFLKKKKKKMSSNENQFDPKFMTKALMNEIKRMMKEEMNDYIRLSLTKSISHECGEVKVNKQV